MSICNRCQNTINKRTKSGLCRSCCQIGKKASIETKNKLSSMRKGVKKTISHRKNISLAKMGDKNPQWMGNKVGYHALHGWIKRNYGYTKPKLCQKCNKNKTRDLSNISGEYLRDVKDWEWLCRRCHMERDGRIHNLKGYEIALSRNLTSPS